MIKFKVHHKIFKQEKMKMNNKKNCNKKKIAMLGL